MQLSKKPKSYVRQCCQLALIVAGTTLTMSMWGCSDAEHPQCDKFIACIGEVSPEQAGPVGTTYGADGACFEAQSTEQCESECAKSLARLAKTVTFDATTYLSCYGPCESDADCKAEEIPYCFTDGRCDKE